MADLIVDNIYPDSISFYFLCHSQHDVWSVRAAARFQQSQALLLHRKICRGRKGNFSLFFYFYCGGNPLLNTRKSDFFTSNLWHTKQSVETCKTITRIILSINIWPLELGIGRPGSHDWIILGILSQHKEENGGCP